MEYPLFSGILPGAGERAVKKTPKVPTLMEPRVGGGQKPTNSIKKQEKPQRVTRAMKGFQMVRE